MVVRPALTFAIHEIREGITERTAEVGAEQLGLEAAGAEICGPIAVGLEISRVHDEFRVRGRVALALRQECVRCLELIEQPVEGALDVLVRPLEVEDESDQGPPEGILYHDGETFSLAEEVRQVVLVEIPANPLCRADCRGLCPRCGGNLNQGGCTCAAGGGVDSRWSALAALKEGQASAAPPAGKKPSERKSKKKT